VHALDTHRDDEHLADAYLDVTLPRAYREIYWPRCLRAMGNIRQRTAEQELDRLADLDCLHVLQQLGEAVIISEGRP
jgi:hypothetical protein